MKTVAIITVSVLLTFVLPALSAASEMITLELTGEAGQSFDGDCSLMQPNGVEKRHRLKGKIPTKLFFPAKAVRCSLHKNPFGKTVTATLIHNNKVAVSLTTHPALNWIVISSSGPWGSAKANNLAARPVW